jgi:hypothetical protein
LREVEYEEESRSREWRLDDGKRAKRERKLVVNEVIWGELHLYVSHHEVSDKRSTKIGEEEGAHSRDQISCPLPSDEHSLDDGRSSIRVAVACVTLCKFLLLRMCRDREEEARKLSEIES